MLQQTLNIEVLMDIWDRTIGDTPARQQFEVWAIDNTLQVVKEGIVATAKRNLKVAGMLPPMDRLRFCSGVIATRTARAAALARQGAR